MFRSCARHADLEEGLRSRDLSEDLKRHAGQCEICDATLLAERLLRQLDETTMVSPKLAPADALWWRSRVLIRLTKSSRREERRPTRILAILVSVLPLLILLTAIAWAFMDQFGQSASPLVPLMMSGAVLAITPVLGWLSFWLADEVLGPI